MVAASCLRAALAATGDHATAAVVDGMAREPADADAEERLEALTSLRVTGPIAKEVRPFEHPVHWGAFVTLGAGAARSHA